MASLDDQNWRYRNNFSQQHRSLSDFKPPSYSKNSEFKQSNERNGSGNFSPQNTKNYQNGNVVKTDTFNRSKSADRQYKPSAGVNRLHVYEPEINSDGESVELHESVSRKNESETELMKPNALRVEVDHSTNSDFSSCNVILDKVQEISLKCEGVSLNAIVDSGCEITCINSTKLLHSPIHSANEIILRPAFGNCMTAKLSVLKMQLDGMANDDCLELTCAVSENFSNDCLLSMKDFRLLKSCLKPSIVAHSNVITKAQQCEKEAIEPNAISVNVNNKDRSNLLSDSECSNELKFVNESENVKSNTLLFSATDVTSDVQLFLSEQRDDSSLLKIFDKLKDVKIFDDYFIHDFDKLLYHKEIINAAEVVQLVVPYSRREQILELAHCSIWCGHLGSDQTFERIRCNFFWPQMTKDIKQFCKSCKDCQLRSRKLVFDRIPIEPVIRFGLPFEVISVDCIRPLGVAMVVTSNGCDYCIVAIDSFSKWVDVVPLKNLTAKSTCEALCTFFHELQSRKLFALTKEQIFVQNSLQNLRV